MNSINVSTSSKKVFLTTLILLLIGAPLLFYVAQQQQTFQQFAWSTKQSAAAICTEQGTVSITVKFTNDESTKDMKVVARDLQTGTTVDLGTVAHGKTAEETIDTGMDSLNKGAVLFTLKWADGTSGNDTRSATYEAKTDCPPPPPYCPADPDRKGVCKWDTLDGADNYNVEVIDVKSGDIITKKTLNGDVNRVEFDMLPGRTYQCKVTSQNSCGVGQESKSPEKTCKPPTPTPSVCPVKEDEGICKWDPLEGATEYKVTIKEGEEVVKEEKVDAPGTQLVYPADPTKTYTCSVIPVGKCNEGPPVESEPKTCSEATPTPSPTPTTPPGQPTPTPTVPPTGTPVPPTATPVPPTPTVVVVTATPPPKPTPTPVVIVRIPPNYQPPPPRQQQTPRIGQPVVQQPAPQTVVQQPAPQQPVVQQPQQPPAQVTPVPTIPPTGALSDSLILVGSSILLVVVGGLLFFAI